jgi:arylsulfatase A-like enzyme
MNAGAALGVGVALGGVNACSSRDEPAPTARRRSGRPNLVVITADDMRADEVVYMPNVQHLLARQGTSFTGARHNIALCSPARAGFLTGQLSKRHRIRSQRDAFARHNDEDKTLPVWLHDAGYDTGIVGKYFTEPDGRTSPPGWDTRRQLADRNQEQSGYRVWDGTHLLAPTIDQPRYLQDQVVRFLERAREPFFLWFAPTADHSPFQAPPTHEHDSTPEWPDRREADVGDKPAWIRGYRPISDDVLEGIRRAQRTRILELLALDDTVEAIMKTLASRGRSSDTVVVFTSDNGMLLGEHRVPPFSKNLPYDPAVLAPCIVRGPGFPHAVVHQPVHMSVDLTATCVALARANPTLRLDGVSLTDVVSDPSAYDERHLLYDRDDRDGLTFGVPSPPPATGVFTRTHKLIRWSDPAGTRELYDLGADPGELMNIADDPAHADERARLEDALDRLLAG